ncbi:MAG: hypothetical protein ACI9E5_000463 [Candidatus Omnitrophota bacterium]|jgi:hypothetical protein
MGLLIRCKYNKNSTRNVEVIFCRFHSKRKPLTKARGFLFEIFSGQDLPYIRFNPVTLIYAILLLILPNKDFLMLENKGIISKGVESKDNALAFTRLERFNLFAPFELNYRNNLIQISNFILNRNITDIPSKRTLFKTSFNNISVIKRA